MVDYGTGFEFYKDYMDMKEQIQEYVAPDLSEFDKQLAVLQEDMKLRKKQLQYLKMRLSLSEIVSTTQ